MIVGLLGALLQLGRPEAMGAEVLLAAGVLAVALAVAAVLRTATAPEAASPVRARDGFAVVRVRLRASDPSAAGHHRARAPGATR